MRAPLLLVLALLLAAPGPAVAATARPKAPAAPAARPAKDPAARGVAGPRMLDDIHIEGEIPVPQVLFITARDQRRFLEFQHRRYLRTSRQLGEGGRLPSKVCVTRGSTPYEKETVR